MEEEERRQIRVLELLKNDVRDTISYNLRKGSLFADSRTSGETPANWYDVYFCFLVPVVGEILRFAIGSTLFGERVNVYTNYPLDGEPFKRNKFNVLPWNASEYKGDESSVFADIDLAVAGSFEYRVEDGIRYKHFYVKR